jgi:hypothetical protein
VNCVLCNAGTGFFLQLRGTSAPYPAPSRESPPLDLAAARMHQAGRFGDQVALLLSLGQRCSNSSTAADSSARVVVTLSVDFVWFKDATPVRRLVVPAQLSVTATSKMAFASLRV